MKSSDRSTVPIRIHATDISLLNQKLAMVVDEKLNRQILVLPVRPLSYLYLAVFFKAKAEVISLWTTAYTISIVNPNICENGIETLIWHRHLLISNALNQQCALAIPTNLSPCVSTTIENAGPAPRCRALKKASNEAVSFHIRTETLLACEYHTMMAVCNDSGNTAFPEKARVVLLLLHVSF